MTVRLCCPGRKPSTSWIPETSNSNPTHVSDPHQWLKQHNNPQNPGWLASSNYHPPVTSRPSLVLWFRPESPRQATRLLAGSLPLRCAS